MHPHRNLADSSASTTTSVLVVAGLALVASGAGSAEIDPSPVVRLAATDPRSGPRQLTRPGQLRLRADALRPIRLEMRTDVITADDRPETVSHDYLTLEPATCGGVPGWLLAWHALNSQVSGLDTACVDAASLAVRWRRMHVRHDRTALARFAETVVEVTESKDGSPPSWARVPRGGWSFDYATLAFVLAAMEKQPGDVFELPSFSPPAKAPGRLSVEVIGQTTVTAGDGGELRAWQVEVISSGFVRTFHVLDDPPYWVALESRHRHTGELLDRKRLLRWQPLEVVAHRPPSTVATATDRRGDPNHP